MSNIGFSRASKHKLYGPMVQSVMLNAVPVWSKPLTKEGNRKKLAMVVRRVVLRLCSAYRTVFEEAVLVIAGLPPIDLVAVSRMSGANEQDTKMPGKMGKQYQRSMDKMNYPKN